LQGNNLNFQIKKRALGKSVRSNCSGAIPILKMIIFCYRWRLFTIFAKREWLFWPAWAGGVKNHIFGAFTLKVDIKQIFFKSNLFKSSTA